MQMTFRITIISEPVQCFVESVQNFIVQITNANLLAYISTKYEILEILETLDAKIIPVQRNKILCKILNLLGIVCT